MKVKSNNLILKNKIFLTPKKPFKASFKSNQKDKSFKLSNKIYRLNNHKLLVMKYKSSKEITIQRKVFKNQIKILLQSDLIQLNGKEGINNEFLRIVPLCLSNSKQYSIKNCRLIKLKRNKPILIVKIKNKCCRESFCS